MTHCFGESTNDHGGENNHIQHPFFCPKRSVSGAASSSLLAWLPGAASILSRPAVHCLFKAGAFILLSPLLFSARLILEQLVKSVSWNCSFKRLCHWPFPQSPRSLEKQWTHRPNPLNIQKPWPLQYWEFQPSHQLTLHSNINTFYVQKSQCIITNSVCSLWICRSNTWKCAEKHQSFVMTNKDETKMILWLWHWLSAHTKTGTKIKNMKMHQWWCHTSENKSDQMRKIRNQNDFNNPSLDFRRMM